MKTRTQTFRPIIYASFALLFLAGAVTAFADDTKENRLSTSTQGQGMERGGLGTGTVTNDEYDALVTTGKRTATPRVAGQQKLSGSASQSGSDSFWIYDADVILYNDQDRDGFFTSIDLLFDADTTYVSADVYAVIYLSYELGPWNEYVSTEDFTIYGAAAGDEYVIDSELVSGYPTGDYDLLIELFDAYDGSFLASFGPEDSSELSFLPLEDAGRDAPITTPSGSTVVVHSSGGGSLGFLGLLVMFGVALQRRRNLGA